MHSVIITGSIVLTDWAVRVKTTIPTHWNRFYQGHLKTLADRLKLARCKTLEYPFFFPPMFQTRLITGFGSANQLRSAL